MTDKELAKTRAGEFTEERGIGYFSFYTGFLARLNEGRLKWHKVANGDVPNNVRYVWTNIGAGYYDNEDGCWRDACSVLQGVVAWCEPKFEEAKEC